MVKPRFGQHFLHDQSIAQREIAYAGITKDDIVLEIGPGMRGLIQKTLRPQSFPMGKVCLIENRTEHHPEGIGYIVVVVLEGTDPTLNKEFILVGGHLDHVGRAPLLMPGANDNASGIAEMLGIAEALAKSPVRTKRSILFIGIGGEELGLLGSLA